MRFFFFVWLFFFSFSYLCTKELLFPLHFTRKMKEKLRPWAETRGQKFDFCIAASWLFSYCFLWHFFHGGLNNFLKWKSTSTFEVTNEFLCLLVCVTPLKVAKMLGKVWHVLIISGFFHSLIWDHLGTAYQTFFNSIYLSFTN